MVGPEKRSIEFTEYLPGPMHSQDRGRNLSPARIAEEISAVAMPMKDAVQGRVFYEHELTFQPASTPALSLLTQYQWLTLPGNSGEFIALVQNVPMNIFDLFFQVDYLARTRTTLSKRGIDTQEAGRNLVVIDPNGNRVIFIARKHR